MSIHYWNQVLRGAERRNIAVEITKEAAYETYLKQKRLCALSGLRIDFPEQTNDSESSTASLDRIDSTKPYRPGNVQWIHKALNKMKMELADGEFIEWCYRVAKHRLDTINLSLHMNNLRQIKELCEELGV
jgi:hypothetical protein